MNFLKKNKYDYKLNFIIIFSAITQTFFLGICVMAEKILFVLWLKKIDANNIKLHLHLHELHVMDLFEIGNSTLRIINFS